MAAYNKFNAFVADICSKVHNLGSDALKVMLSNVAPVATNAIKTDITDIAAGNGYSAGGNAVTVTTASQTSGTYTLAANQVVFTSNTGDMAAFRYVVLYNSTPANGNLVAWWDYGSALTLHGANGDTFTVQFNSASPGTIFTLA